MLVTPQKPSTPRLAGGLAGVAGRTPDALPASGSETTGGLAAA
jgi:hypothetical protein